MCDNISTFVWFDENVPCWNDFDPQVTFDINGNKVNSDASGVIALKHGQALEAISLVRSAINNINKVGSLENAVEVYSFRNLKGV